MRTIKELLELLLENKIFFRVGLCGWVDNLHWNGKINFEECILLNKHIKHNRPSMFSSWDAFQHSNSCFYWKAGDIKPRIKWIKKHIKLNS